MQIWSPRPL